MDLYQVLSKIAVPRPNHSDALADTALYIEKTLTAWRIPFTVQQFTLRPYQHLIIGITCLLLALVFLYCIYKKKPIAAACAVLAIPVLLILEFMYWKKNGVFLKFYHAEPELVKRLNAASIKASGKPIESAGNVTDDAIHFMAAGVPAVTVGNSGEDGLGLGGFHSTLDGMSRVDRNNLACMARFLRAYIQTYNEYE